MNRAKATWVGVIVGFLALSVGSHVVLLAYALTDPSFAVEPDYEQKAARFGEELAQRAHNEALGWTTAVTADTTVAPARVHIALRDGAGRPVTAAVVDVEAAHLARSAKILKAECGEAEAGSYGAELALTRSGIWEFRIRAARGGDVFTALVRESILVPPSGPESRP